MLRIAIIVTPVGRDLGVACKLLYARISLGRLLTCCSWKSLLCKLMSWVQTITSQMLLAQIGPAKAKIIYATVTVTQKMAQKWQLEGTLFDTCNCETLCPCVYFQAPQGEDCRATAVWHIEKGYYGDTRLDDFTIAGIIYATQNLLTG